MLIVVSKRTRKSTDWSWRKMWSQATRGLTSLRLVYWTV